MSKHTPGPWFPCDDDMERGVDDILSIIIFSGAPNADAEDGVCVASVSAFGLAEIDENVFSPSAPDDNAVAVAKANARLIAAAPDLLAALCALRSCVKDDTAAARVADAAISKATGEAA